MSRLDEFFVDLDAQWPATPGPKLQLSLIGSGALMLQSSFRRGTKDSDVFETTNLTPAIQAQLLAIAGAGTDIHRLHRMYLDIVRNGIPFLPHVPTWRAVPALDTRLTKVELRVLDVVDVVVSKLKRFHANDQSDIDAMIELGLVDHAHLVARFRAAVYAWIGDARAEDLPKYIGHLHRVERDMLLVDETEIELPSWI